MDKHNSYGVIVQVSTRLTPSQTTFAVRPRYDVQTIIPEYDHQNRIENCPNKTNCTSIVHILNGWLIGQMILLARWCLATLTTTERRGDSTNLER